VDQKELPLITAAAAGLIYPSFYEGFGLPVAEAMACGTPVIAANASALPQVLADCGQLIAPNNVKGFTSAIEKLIEDRNFSQSCTERGLKRAEALSWNRAAGDIREIYRVLIEKT
jgi:alpha-1,3-rhamnosyl/mannosyltransferase